ncbi:MAG TPA: OmpA family protein [Chloroflexia bacterium]|nr:OmpA family protein [Chloroflexia bacterium]
MADETSRDHDDHKRVQRTETHTGLSPIGGEGLVVDSISAAHSALLGDPRLDQRGNAPVRNALIQRMQSTFGNRAVVRLLQRKASASQATGGNAPAPAIEVEAGIDNGPDTSPGQLAEAQTEQATHDSAPAEAAQRQADPHHAGSALAGLPARGSVVQRASGALAVQRDITGTPKTAHGQWDIKGIKKEGALATPATASGIDISLKFKPFDTAPYSNKIGIIQIIKVTAPGGGDLPILSLPTLPARRRQALVTKEDTAAGVEKGYFTDVLHRDFGPGRPNTDSAERSNQTQNYQGGAPVFGFKRSNDPADIKAAEITDFPGTSSNTVDVDFGFETVARGDDVQQIYGGVKWAFGLRAGKVVNESGPTPADTGSATFNSAVNKHREFYTHEPVNFYFDFDSRTPSAAELARIDTFLDYVTRNADVRLSLKGFADQRGNAAYNQTLARDRSNAIAQALRGRGIDNARIDVQAPGGATAEHTQDATTSQDSDANRRGNRVVTLTFVRVPIPLTP